MAYVFREGFHHSDAFITGVIVPVCVFSGVFINPSITGAGPFFDLWASIFIVFATSWKFPIEKKLGYFSMSHSIVEKSLRA